MDRKSAGLTPAEDQGDFKGSPWPLPDSVLNRNYRNDVTLTSRSGTPIEIVSKVILRHAHLSTTQRYLGKVTDVEAIRWIENLYA